MYKLQELAQLFEDMQMMVEEQGQTFDQIEQNAQNTSGDIEQGVKHVDRAIILARSTRAVSYYITYLCILNTNPFFMIITIEKMVLFLYHHYSCRCHCYPCLVVRIWSSRKSKKKVLYVTLYLIIYPNNRVLEEIVTTLTNNLLHDALNNITSTNMYFTYMLKLFLIITIFLTYYYTTTTTITFYYYFYIYYPFLSFFAKEKILKTIHCNFKK